MRRMSQVLFAFFQTVTDPRDPHIESPSDGTFDEASGRQYATAISLRQAFFRLPAELQLVADRMTSNENLNAAGFSDPLTATVGIDVASWSRPCSEVLDEIAWRRVFTWIVGTDSQLMNVAILDPPIQQGNRLVGSYAYDSEDIPGYGVLQVAAGDDGCWHICDCWGDATDAERIDTLSSFTPRT